MKGRKPVQISRYTYASGRIRAMEIQLLDSGRLNRLFEARSAEDVTRILTESGYPPAADPETSLNRETIEIYELMSKLMVDKEFLDALLLFHDFHNLKVTLKSLTSTWPHTAAADASDLAEELPESSSLFSYQTFERLMLLPSIVKPQQLFQAIRDRQSDQIPAWLYSAAVQAARRYQLTYDISDIDLALDRAACQEALKLAGQLNNDFFSQYLSRRSDLTNLSLLLRTRFLQNGEAYLKDALLPGGMVPPDLVLDCYRGSVEDIQTLYAATPYVGLAAMAEHYGERGTASRFSQMSDNLIIELLRTVRWTLRGPEIPLAYLIARELEIKNIRIVLTCLRNGLPSSQASELARDSYLTWR